MKEQVVIYERPVAGEVVKFRFDREAETIWATVEEMAAVFEVDRSVISRHVRNIYASGELSEAATCAKNAQVREEGGRLVTRQVKRFNLDMIISVGYRVNSKKATKFRIWASQIVHDYIVKGVAVNEGRLAEVSTEKLKSIEGALMVVRRLMGKNELSAGDANGVLEVIAKYAESFESLRGLERQKIVRLSRNFAGRKKFDDEAVTQMVAELRASEGEGRDFGRVRDVDALVEVMKIFEGKDGYASVPEAAANLLYLVARRQPFEDGNKRIAALFFIVFLTYNDYNLAENGETKISDRALVALTLLMGESEDDEKELLIKLVERLLK